MKCYKNNVNDIQMLQNGWKILRNKNTTKINVECLKMLKKSINTKK